MKLWKLFQNINNDYDTYDSAVVAANTEEEAKQCHPDNSRVFDVTRGKWYMEGVNGNRYYDSNEGSWVMSPQDVMAEYLGEAKEGTEAGVIVSSFNAG